MLVHLLMIVLAVSPNEAEFNTENVSVKVTIQSNIFSYEVTNLGNSPIMAVQLHEHSAYDFQTPEGWQKEIKNGIFRAWTNVSTNGIFPREKAVFSLRVSSRGAVLKKLPVKVRFDSDQVVTVANVWSSAPEPTSYILFIAGIMASLFILHSCFIYKHSKNPTTAIA